MADRENPVTILLQNHQLLVILFAGVVWLLQKLGFSGKKPPVRPSAGGSVQTTRAETDDETAARTRRVQEEVRRKIAERRAATVMPPNLSPRSAPAINLPHRSSRSASEDGPLMVPQPSDETEPDSEAAEFSRQQKLESQLRELDAARAAAARQAAALSASAVPVGQAAGLAGAPPVLSPWLAELRDPSSFRRAVILREVLGPPIALKGF